MGKLRTIDGNFYVGYKRDYCFTNRELNQFHKIDKDGDGILSDAEIIARRKKEARRGQIATVIGLAMGISMTLAGIDKKSVIAAIVGGSFCLISAYNQSTINSEKEKTENYEKEYKLNTNC